MTRVLIVDDDLSKLQVLTHVLTAAGFEVLGAASGREGIRLAVEAHPEIMLLDVMLPDINGLDVCRRVKADGSLQATTVILLSAVETSTDRQADGLESGADGYIAQPISNRELVARIQAVLRFKEAESALRASQRSLTALLSNLPGMAYRCADGAGRTMEFVSDRCQEITGYSANELLHNRSASYRDLIHEDDRQRASSEIESALNENLPFHVTYRINTRQGQEKWIWEQGRAVPGDDGSTRVEGLIVDVSDRLRLEAERDEHQSMIRALLKTTPDVVIFKDRRSVFLACSDSFCRMFGFSKNHVIGKSDSDLFPDDAERYRIEEIRAMESGQPIRAEHLLKTINGPRWFESIKAPVRDRAGEVIGVLCTERDITDRKQTVQALVDSRDFYLRLFQDFPTLMWRTGTDGKFNYVNASWLSFTGRSLEEELGDGWAERVHPDDLERCLAVHREAVASRRPFQTEYRLCHHNGNYRWFVNIGQPITGMDGEFEGCMGACYDITERKQAEDVLWQTKLVVEHSSVVLFRWNGPDKSTVDFVSENVAQHGYAPAEFLSGQVSYSSIIHPDDLSRVISDVKTGTEHGAESLRQEYRIITKERKLRWVEDRTVIIRSETGQVTHYQATVQDITERKSLEAQLLQSQKMETVGRLAGGVAHDFNNILTAIKGYASLLRQNMPKGGQARADLEQLIKATERASTLTHRLLAFSRRQIIALKLVNLDELILDLDRMLRRLIGEDVELVTLPAASPWLVNADPGQIEQALVNLVVNARDAMPLGGKVTIKTSNRTVEGSTPADRATGLKGEYVVMSITDTGVGMNDEVKSHVFEPFFTTKETGKGTGLGLATVYGIVKQHQGHIIVTSEAGDGTCVEIYLPRAYGQIDHPPRREEASEPARGDETILLVEDEPLVRGLAVRVLRSRGYEVLEASNGDEALRRAHEYPGRIHLLLSDIVMPQMNGKALAERLGSLRPDCRILFMSGYTDDAIIRHGVQEKQVAFLHKPFTETTLAHKVREVLDNCSDCQV